MTDSRERSDILHIMQEAGSETARLDTGNFKQGEEDLTQQSAVPEFTTGEKSSAILQKTSLHNEHVSAEENSLYNNSYNDMQGRL